MIITYICGKPCFTICGKPNFQNQFLITICGNDKIEGKRAKKGQNPLTKHLSVKKAVFEFGLPFAVIFYSIPCPAGKAWGEQPGKTTQTGSKTKRGNNFGVFSGIFGGFLRMVDNKIEMPIRKKGRPSKALIEENQRRKSLFCEALIKIQSTLDFKISSRGWCYQLEDLAGLSKSDFDFAQNLINECRKNGMLPLGFTASDEARALQGGSIYTDDENPEEFVQYQIDQIKETWKYYKPKCLQDFHNYGIVVMVEKIDLVGLFNPVCKKYNVPIFNARGWSDINSRGDLLNEMLNFLKQQKTCLVLYCGDHDPAGLNISNLLPKNLKDIEQAVGIDSSLIRIERFGLDYDFIKKHNLSWIDNLDTSNPDTPSLDNPKHPDHKKAYVQDYIKKYGVRKCEANSLVVRHEAGRKLLADTLGKYISDEQINQYEEFLKSEQSKVQNILNSINISI